MTDQITAIKAAVSGHFGCTPYDLESQSRHKAVVRARHIAMWLIRVTTYHSLPEIGLRFGGRDHTTVLYAVCKITGALNADASLRDDIDCLLIAMNDTGTVT